MTNDDPHVPPAFPRRVVALLLAAVVLLAALLAVVLRRNGSGGVDLTAILDRSHSHEHYG